MTTDVPTAESVRAGFAVIDKPAGWTSHDVVARLRRVFGTRRVGHAGTLDPMATGVLVCGIGRATRLLGYLSGSDKQYQATIRLGVGTDTDDAEGNVIATTDASSITSAGIRSQLRLLAARRLQRPSAVSAIKIGGERAYRRVRAGEQVDLPERPVKISRLDVTAVRLGPAETMDIDVVVDCSSGTYIRAIARDLGADLGVGGHLTALRRTRVGPFDLAQANPVTEAELIGIDEVCALIFDRVDVSMTQADDIGHGRTLFGVVNAEDRWHQAADDQADPGISGAAAVSAAFDPAGQVIALVRPVQPVGSWRPVLVLRPANASDTPGL